MFFFVVYRVLSPVCLHDPSTDSSITKPRNGSRTKLRLVISENISFRVNLSAYVRFTWITVSCSQNRIILLLPLPCFFHIQSTSFSTSDGFCSQITWSPFRSSGSPCAQSFFALILSMLLLLEARGLLRVDEIRLNKKHGLDLFSKETADFREFLAVFNG